MAIAAIAARPARGCYMDSFLIVGGLDLNQKATAGEKVWFQVGFSMGRMASVKIDYGDGTVEGDFAYGYIKWHPAIHPAGPLTIQIDHVYTKPGTFRAFLKEGLVDNWGGPNLLCAPSGSVGPGGGIQVNVVRAKHLDAALQVPALAQPKRVVAIPPASGQGAKDLGVQLTVGKERNLAHALSPGQIVRASVSQSVLGNLLKVEGSGKCGLKVFEELDGKALKTYDFKGPLPTTITLARTGPLPGLHVVRIEGDKSSESCGGTASASFPIAKKKGVL
jgi:hypothetical protein